MLKKLLFDLQLFAEGGGDGGDGGSASASVGEALGNKEESGEIEIPRFVPEKAKKIYQKAMEKQKGSTTNAETQTDDIGQPTNDQSATEEPSYQDIIKSDKYKDDHEAYIKQTIGDRLKKYKGIEERLEKQKALLDNVAYKYGINPDDENYMEVLEKKIGEDDSFYENYAIEHNIDTDTARKIVQAERIISRQEEQRQEEEKREQVRQHIMVLRQNAEKTKAQFPDFDLDAMMENETFRRLCASTNGDTTSAYVACNWGQILPATVQMASKKIQQQTAQAVASNKARPIENGLSSTAPSVVQEDFKGWSLQQLNEYKNKHFR